MKHSTTSKFLLAALLWGAAPVLVSAQEEPREKKDVQEIIITRTGDKKDKVVIEIKDEKVTINGKPAGEYADQSDIKVRLRQFRDQEALVYRTPGGRNNMIFNWNENPEVLNIDEKRAMLGVTTQKTEQGAEVQDVTKESAAEKAGLKAKDIITRIGDKKIEGPDDLAEAVRKHKPGDKVTVTILRNGKEQKINAELGSWKGFSGTQNFRLRLDDLELEKLMPHIPDFKMLTDHYMQRNRAGAPPKLGLSVQDTDDGMGVKVVEVDEESNASKAGIQDDDIITHVDETAVNNVDEISKLLKEKKERVAVKMTINRKGKTQNIDVKMPRKIKTAEL